MLDYGMNLQEQPPGQHERYGFQLLNAENQDMLGTTYKALALDTQEAVSVRLFAPAVDLAAGLVQALEDHAYQFGQLNHTNLQRILSFFNGEEGSLLVGDYISGMPLDEYLQLQGVLDWQYATRILRQILRGLDYAHAAGFVHRSLSPRNLVVTRGNTIKITNFGLAHLAKQYGFSTEEAWEGSPLLQYAAPEALTDEFLTPVEASDIYSVGLIAYEMLTGVSPVSAEEEAYAGEDRVSPPKLAPVSHVNQAVPEQLSAIVQKAMEQHAIHRYASAASMLEALDALAAAPLKQSVVYYQKTRFRPRRLRISPAMLLLCCGVLALAGSAYFYMQSKNLNPFVALQTNAPPAVRPNTGMPAVASAALANAPPAAADSSANGTAAPLRDTTATTANLPLAASEMAEAPLPAASFQQATGTHTLTVRSRPTGASIRVGGRKMGKTPFQLANVPGPTASISLSLAGYRNITREIELEDDFQTDAYFNLTPINRRVILSVFPWGNVYLDGDLVAERVAGRDTLMISPTHQVLRVIHPSFGTWETPLNATDPDSLNFKVDFRERASLSITAFDENQRSIEGAVFINGRDINLVTPLTIELPLGNHMVEVRASGFEPIRINTTIDPNRGLPQPLNLQMKRK